MTRTRGQAPNRTPFPARTQGGTDLQAPVKAEIAGVAGDVATLDTAFADHSARHENGGADEISIAGLSGVAADPQTPAAHTHDAADINAGTLPDARFPATLPAANGSNLTNLNATALASGIVHTDRLGGASGSFTTVDGKTVTVTNGLITAIV